MRRSVMCSHSSFWSTSEERVYLVRKTSVDNLPQNTASLPYSYHEVGATKDDWKTYGKKDALRA